MRNNTSHAEPDVDETKMDLVIDPSMRGLDSLFPEYTSRILKAMWIAQEDPEFNGITSRDAFDWYKEYAKDHKLDSRSRAAIIIQLNILCARGILEYEEETCKGGNRRRYSPKLSPSDFEELLRVELEIALDENIFYPKWPSLTYYRTIGGTKNA